MKLAHWIAGSVFFGSATWIASHRQAFTGPALISMTTSPSGVPEYGVAPAVLSAPTPDAPAPPAEVTAPSLLMAPTPPTAPAPALTGAQPWRETPSPRERPELLVTNGCDFPLRLVLRTGEQRDPGTEWNVPAFGQVTHTVRAGEYDYAVYGSSLYAPTDPNGEPGMVGKLRCRRFNQYTVDFGPRAPELPEGTLRIDLGDTAGPDLGEESPHAKRWD